jgi:hypothetical protein
MVSEFGASVTYIWDGPKGFRNMEGEGLVLRLTATEVGFFEDYEDEEVLEVGISGVDDAGVRRSFSVQRSTHGPDEQDVLVWNGWRRRANPAAEG